MENNQLKLMNTEKGPIAWMATNPVASNLLMIALLAGGIFFAIGMRQEVFPDFDLDQISIVVPYPGASPAEVEKGITATVEEAVKGFQFIKDLKSYSREGVGQVIIDMLPEEDIHTAVNDIKGAIDRIRTFPNDAEEPTVQVLERRRRVLTILVYGDLDLKKIKEYTEFIRDRFISNPGITQAEIGLIKPYEITVEVSEENLRHYGLTIQNISQAIARNSLELPSGSIKTRQTEIMVRVTERKDYGSEIGSIPIITRAGQQVLLRDLATINDGFAEVDFISTFEGQPSSKIDVYRVGSEKPGEVSKAVYDVLAEIKNDLPSEVDVRVWQDSSVMFTQRVELLVKNALMGGILVIILLSLFLDWKLALWVTAGIPISFIGAFILISQLGITINMMTLFAFLISLGVVVDDAIVVGENIYEMRQKGHSFSEAAIKGVKQITMPVTFSVLTNIVAYIPLLHMPGTMGKMFYSIPVVVMCVFAISLIESLVILPAHLAHSRPTNPNSFFSRFQKKINVLLNQFLIFVYKPTLLTILKYRYVSVSIGIFVLMITIAYVQSGRMGFTQFPRVDSDSAKANLVMPLGSPIEKTEAIVDKIVAAAEELRLEYPDLVDGIAVMIGKESDRSASNIAEVDVGLTDPSIRPISTIEFVDLWRKKIGELSGIKSLKYRSVGGGPGGGADITLQLSHNNLSVLENASKELAEHLKQYSIVKEVDDGYTPGKQQIDIKVNDLGKELGVSSEFLARSLRNAYYGNDAIRFQRGREEIKVVVRYPEDYKNQLHSLEAMTLQLDGREIPLMDVVDIQKGTSYTEIIRRKSNRVSDVTANLEDPKEADAVIKEVYEKFIPQLYEKYPLLYITQEGKQAENKESIGSLVFGTLLIFALIYGLLAIPFKSYTQPVIIMFVIPFGLVGAVVGHLLLDFSLSIMSIMGLIALAGIAVNDSLVFVDYANRLRVEENRPALAAIVEAGMRRFRPIFLTTATTFVGLMPIIFETSRQARFLIPMALSLGFGVLIVTLTALLLLPCLYIIIEDLKAKLGVETHNELNN